MIEKQHPTGSLKCIFRHNNKPRSATDLVYHLFDVYVGYRLYTAVFVLFFFFFFCAALCV